MTKWQQEQLRLENAYVLAMLHEDGIVETTTKRQWKNGTRQFNQVMYVDVTVAIEYGN